MKSIHTYRVIKLNLPIASSMASIFIF